MNESLRRLIGWLFSWKLLLAAVIIIASVFISRFFCRFICPLGAFYSLFNRISIFGVKVDEHKCTHCGRCVRQCRMDVNKIGDRECIQCGECKEVCPEGAVSIGIKKTVYVDKKLQENN